VDRRLSLALGDAAGRGKMRSRGAIFSIASSSVWQVWCVFLNTGLKT
jgi:hypothetical protein